MILKKHIFNLTVKKLKWEGKTLWWSTADNFQNPKTNALQDFKYILNFNFKKILATFF